MCTEQIVFVTAAEKSGQCSVACMCCCINAGSLANSS